MIAQHDSLGSFFTPAAAVLVQTCVTVLTGVGGAVTGVVTTEVGRVSVSGDNRFMVARLELESIVLAASHLVDADNF